MSALMAVANEGDDVIIIEPYHENYSVAVEFAGAKAVYVPLIPPHYELDLDRLRAAFSDKTRAILLNTPHNPTGGVFTGAEMEESPRSAENLTRSASPTKFMTTSFTMGESISPSRRWTGCMNGRLPSAGWENHSH